MARLRTHRAHHGIRAYYIIIGVATGQWALTTIFAIINFDYLFFFFSASLTARLIREARLKPGIWYDWACTFRWRAEWIGPFLVLAKKAAMHFRSSPPILADGNQIPSLANLRSAFLPCRGSPASLRPWTTCPTCPTLPRKGRGLCQIGTGSREGAGTLPDFGHTVSCNSSGKSPGCGAGEGAREDCSCFADCLF